MSADAARPLEVGDELLRLEFVDGRGGTWTTDAHRATGRPLLLILHRHLA